MRLLLLFALLLGIGVPARADMLSSGGGPHILSALVPESGKSAAGRRTTLAVSMTPQPGWHGYWKTPGDSGLASKFDWTLPAGVRAGDAAYPVPTTLLIAGLMNHVYERPYALLVPIDVPAGLAAGTRLPIALTLDYLVCTTSLCVPEQAKLATTLTVGDGRIDPATATRFDAWRRDLPQPLGAAATFVRDAGRLRVALPWPADAPLDAPHLFVETEGAAAPAAAQSFARDGDRLVIETGAGTPPVTAFDAVLATGEGRGVAFRATPGAVHAVRSGGGGAAAVGTLGAFVLALAGGLLLNIMPCVFPILSLKALSLARASGEERRVRREALAYTGGVVAVCLALGALIIGLRAGGHAVGWAFQLQSPYVIATLLVLTAAIALNLAGLFELGMVTAGSGLAGREGAAGAFWTGALAAFVATPCTGPFMAAALGAALVLPAAAAMLVFLGLGLGLALPFLAIGLIPALRRALPRPGPWMVTFRHVMAVPMLATALGLAWVLARQAGGDAAVVGMGAALLLGIGLWATGLRQGRGVGKVWRPAMIGLLLGGVAVAALPVARPVRAAAGHVAFDEAKLAALRAGRRPVFLYLTADWCLSCKVNEKAAIERSATQAAFARAGVTTMVGDWTDGDPAIGRFLEAHGRSGVPLYLWYAPGAEAKALPQILTPGMLAGLAQGRS